jgi:hypothetical protein
MSSSVNADDPVITEGKLITGCSAFAEHDSSVIAAVGVAAPVSGCVAHQ